MISYRITSKTSATIPDNTSGKDLILSRAVKKATHLYKVGDLFSWRGSKRKGTILEIVAEPTRVHWKGEKPFFIKLKFDDNGQTVLAHASSIKKVKS